MKHFAILCSLFLALPYYSSAAESVRANRNDSVNQWVLQQTTLGFVASLLVDGKSMTVQRVIVTRVAKARPANGKGDTVLAVGLRDGREVVRVTIQDPLYSIVEHSGLVRNDRRQIIVALPTEQRLDQIDITLSANGASAKIDARPAIVEFCRAQPTSSFCQN